MMMSHTVMSADLAAAASQPTVRCAPHFLAPSRMIELMELAALRLMKSRLRDGESSVGIEMNVTHATPGAVCGVMRAVASYRGVSGRLHRFAIHAFDETGLIGTSEHTRAVVGVKKLLAAEARREGNPENVASA
jgi:fluoroacetyl-CoA thioesterase